MSRLAARLALRLTARPTARLALRLTARPAHPLCPARSVPPERCPVIRARPPLRSLPGLALPLALSALACDAPLSRIEQVTGPRVLGARVEVAGDPARATPAAGEAFTVRWLVVDADGELAAGHRAELCLADATAVGAVGCAEAPLPPALTAPGAPLESTWTAPVEGARSLLTALFCAGAAVRPDGQACEDGSPPLAASLVLDHELDPPNGNPALGAGALTVEGRAWAPGACPAPASAPGARVTVEWRGAATTRDAEEALQLGLFVTGGTVEHPLVVIERDATIDPIVARFAWQLPSRAGATPLHAWLVARDGRGGSDFAARTLCAAP